MSYANSENTSRLLGTPDRRSNRAGQEHSATESNSMGHGEEICADRPVSANRPAATADRGDAIREIAANLERLCIEYACHSRVNGTGNETRAVWAQFKAQIEALKAAA